MGRQFLSAVRLKAVADVSAALPRSGSFNLPCLCLCVTVVTFSVDLDVVNAEPSAVSSRFCDVVFH